MGKISWGLKITLALGVIGTIGLYGSVGAMQFSSADYLIDTATLNNVGGYSSSADYQLTSSGGEAAIGNGSSGSYMMPAGYVAQLPSMISVKTEPSGLVGYWPMDEGSGTETYDASANGNNGTLVGNPAWATGKVGSAVTFNGTSQYADLGDASALQNSVMTVEAWIKTSQTSGSMEILNKDSAFDMEVNYSSLAIYDPSSGNVCSSGVNVADGNWHQIVVSYNGGVTNGTVIYIDGVQKATCTWKPQNQTADLTVGAAYSGGSISGGFNGTIDQIKIFNRILSPQEVAAEYAAQNAGIETGLTLQTIIPGASNTSPFSVITQTTAGGYNLAINENHDLQNGSNTIPAISGSIASPMAWNEGTTKGLGFTLTGTNATPIAASWNNGTNYAALPLTATTFYTRTGTQSSKDTVNLQLRADVPPGQASGTYTNTMTITGTANP